MKSIRKRILDTMMPYWTKGFITSNFISLFNPGTFISKAFFYLIVLRELGNETMYCEVHTKLQLFGIQVTEEMLNRKKEQMRDMLPKIHPYIHCIHNK